MCDNDSMRVHPFRNAQALGQDDTAEWLIWEIREGDFKTVSDVEKRLIEYLGYNPEVGHEQE